MPTIALCGRTNVGKSTFFNIVTKTKNALVSDFPGLTRDRQYGFANFENKQFILIDTGGIDDTTDLCGELTKEQSLYALEEADIVFFFIDARAGINAADNIIAERLRRLNKTLYLIINKTEGLESNLAIAEFSALGFKKAYAISAAHNTGIFDLLTDVTADFPTTIEETLFQEEEVINVAFIGRPNVGKSTLMNRILGENRVVVSNIPGTTRDSIEVQFEKDNCKYNLIDTAGVRRRGRVSEKIEKFSIVKTLNSIEKAQVCLMLIDASEGLTDQDLNLLGLLLDSGKALVLVINKWDNLDYDHKNLIKEQLDRKLKFASFFKTRFISALHGSGVGILFKDIIQAYKSSKKTFSTSLLTRTLQDLIQKHPPPLVNGRRIKLRYAHIGGHNPPIIVIHGNQVDSLPQHYKRYLSHAFIEVLKLIGTPIKIEFKSSENPYKDKVNVLTHKQIKKRQRLYKK